MKSCNWYLLMNGSKIYNIRQLRENFDTQFVTGYFLGGSLIKWLLDIGEIEIADRVSATDLNGDIGKQLQFAFGVVPDLKTSPTDEKEIESIVNNYPVHDEEKEILSESVITSSYRNVAGSVCELSAGSFKNLLSVSDIQQAVSSFKSGSFLHALAGQGLNSSFSAAISGSVHGGFMSGSASGSFSGFSGSYNGIIFSSLNSGSGKAGSFGSFGGYGNIWMFTGEGSFRYGENGVVITADEYQKTLINLSSCPLNAYGYGINLI
ncbi:MAG: hypothetical protein J6X60_01450 [Ruminiclostridium sp.]|nr:hypothetical protein [Ruminiclostridium sp.]